MRLVLDSNVIIAAFAARGLCQALFEYCLENHEIFLCRAMLDEIDRALIHKLGVPRKIAAEVSSCLNASAVLVDPASVEPGLCRDKSDLAVIGTALAAQADYLITGDQDLLSLRKYERTKIVDPRSFWVVSKKLK
jgi:putative PIN family toxin of toxin-antitoxin system